MTVKWSGGERFRKDWSGDILFVVLADVEAALTFRDEVGYGAMWRMWWGDERGL
jgi:hypothetical protein